MACCGVVQARISTFISVVLSLCLTLYSLYLFKEYYEQKYSNTTKALDSAGNFFNSIAGDNTVNLTRDLNIKLFCTGTAAGAAAIQFLTSFLVLVCAGGEKAGPSTAKLFLFFTTWIILALGGVIACYFTAKIDYQNDDKVLCFLIGCVVDLVFLLLVGCGCVGGYLRA